MKAVCSKKFSGSVAVLATLSAVFVACGNSDKTTGNTPTPTTHLTCTSEISLDQSSVGMTGETEIAAHRAVVLRIINGELTRDVNSNLPVGPDNKIGLGCYTYLLPAGHAASEAGLVAHATAACTAAQSEATEARPSVEIFLVTSFSTTKPCDVTPAGQCVLAAEVVNGLPVIKIFNFAATIDPNQAQHYCESEASGRLSGRYVDYAATPVVAGPTTEREGEGDDGRRSLLGTTAIGDEGDDA